MPQLHQYEDINKTPVYNNQNCESAIRGRKSLVFDCCLTEKYIQNVEDDVQGDSGQH